MPHAAHTSHALCRRLSHARLVHVAQAHPARASPTPTRRRMAQARPPAPRACLTRAAIWGARAPPLMSPRWRPCRPRACLTLRPCGGAGAPGQQGGHLAATAGGTQKATVGCPRHPQCPPPEQRTVRSPPPPLCLSPCLSVCVCLVAREDGTERDRGGGGGRRRVGARCALPVASLFLVRGPEPAVWLGGKEAGGEGTRT